MDKASIFEINPSVLIDLYNVKLSQLDKEKEKAINSEIDELNFKIEGYRKSETFRERRDVAAKFHYQSPFNAYLVNLQFPGASLVLTQSQWKKYNRRPTVNARPILYLNFSPLGCLFDISDTEQIPNLPIRTDSEILDEIDNQLRNSSGKVRREYMEHLIENISKLGVFLNTRLEASNQYSGYICYDQEHSVGFVYNKEYIQHRNRFIISINKNYDETNLFVTLCHELGHLLCQHLWYDTEKVRKLTHEEKEFEAETVSWLVCKHFGINNPSEEYLETSLKTEKCQNMTFIASVRLSHKLNL